MNWLQSKLEDEGFHHGLIFTPENADTLFGKEAQAVLAEGHSGMIGTMSPRMRDALEAGDKAVGWRMTTLEAPLGQMLLVVAVQVGPCQARFLAHMRDPQARLLLDRCCQGGEISVLLVSADGSGQPSRLRGSFTSENRELVQFLADERQPLTDLQRLMSFAFAAVGLRKQLEMLEIPGFPAVEDVTVNAILWRDGAVPDIDAPAALLH